MDNVFWVGMIAATLSTVAFLPQLIKTHRTKHTKDLSLVMYIIFSLGISLWTIYGFMIHQAPIIAANSVTLAMTLYLLYLKVKYG